ncbi:MAG: NAD(P)/FAD-dependent oxidoreductase [Candidatus Omnitrophota bacterium]
MNVYDVIIIGGGIVGTAIARELSKYKIKTALLEKEEELAFGVSKSNSGIIHPGTQNPPDSLKGKLCVAGNLLTRELSQELGFDFKEVGELIVAFDVDEIPRLFTLKKSAEILGVPGLQVVDRMWLREKEPNLSHAAIAALYAPTAGIVSPYRMVYDLAENAARNGTDIYTECAVKNIIKLEYSTRAFCKEYSRFEIITEKHVFRARYIINSAGLFADDVAKMVGINDFTIYPRKGEEFLLDKKREYLTNHLLFPLPSKNSKGVLVIKTSDGNPMIGPTAEEVEDKTDLSTSDEGFQNVMTSVRRLVPSIEESDIIAYFAGLRPVSGKDFIIRYEKNTPGFINVAGIQSPGLTSAPAVALFVRELLKEHGLKLTKKKLFHKTRKKTIHLFSEPLKNTKKLISKNPAYGDIVCRCEMVSRGEIEDAISRGAKTMDGIKFRTRAQAGRCHGGFCTTRIMKILSEKTGKKLTEITKRGKGSELIKQDRADD